MTFRQRLRLVPFSVVVVGALALPISCKSEKTRLADAMERAEHRPVEGRLSGLPWARAARATRLPDQTTRPDLGLRSVAAELRSTSDDEGIQAVASLLAGDRGDATRRLRSLAERAPSATAWNDLAVSLVDEAGGDIATLCRALAAADRALDLQPALSEGLFNRALILESLALEQFAAEAYREFLRTEGTTSWADEARMRLREIERKAAPARTWQERLPDLLRTAIAPGDRAAIREAVASLPQDARILTQTEVLGLWGDKTITGDPSAASHLALGREVGSALRAAKGDEMLAEAVTAIDAASEEPERMLQLARAHAAYSEGRRRYRSREAAIAAPLFQEASRLFRTAGSPMHLRADYYLANASIDLGDRPAAEALAMHLARDTPARYRALRAELDWLEAILAGMNGSFEQSLRSFERAAATFDSLGETQLAIDMYDRIAGVLTMLGRTNDAWLLRRRSFAIAGRSDNPRRLESTLYSAITDALREQQWDVAHSLLALVVTVDGGNVRLHAEALVWRVLAATRAAMHRTAASDLTIARQASRAIPDEGLREDVANELRLVEALLVRTEDPNRSVALLTEHLASAHRRGRTTRLAQVLVERARDLRTIDRTSEAEADLRNAIALIETQRSTIRRDDLRDSFLGTSSTPYAELSDLLDEGGDSVGAILAADQRRARLLLDRLERTSGRAQVPLDREFTRLIPDGVSLLSWGLFEDRLVIFVCSARGIERFVAPARGSAVRILSAEFLDALGRSDASGVRVKGAELHRLLIAPAMTALERADTLEIVTDDAVQGVPFGALVAADGTFLVERFTIRVAPSIRRVVTAEHFQATRKRALVVGNPLVDGDFYRHLPPLPAAEDEARRVAAMYRSPVLLLRGEATKARLVGALTACDVVHIASHALEDPLDPRRSRLLLAGTGQEGILTAGEVASMRLDHLRWVILAGCRTAASGKGYGDVRSLAAAFLAAGAHEVVASLWNVDDRMTRELSLHLHRALIAGMSPASAVRDAQLRMIRSGSADLSTPTSWASIQVYGFGGREVRQSARSS